DIEWGISAGKIYLLQARAIKARAAAPDQAEREQVRQEEMAALQARAEPTGTVWSRYNLSEILPEPTPMTWAIVRRFMSVAGGFGQMYIDLGFDPDPTLGEEGVFDLVCGRPYYNLSREPRMLYRRAPLEHPFAKLKQEPHKAIYPQPVPNPGKMGIGKFLLWLPVVAWQMMRTVSRCRRLTSSFHKELREQIIPAFSAEVAEENKVDLGKLSDKELLDRLERWQKRTLVDFARHSLKPTALAGQAMGKLEQVLSRSLPPERARAALGELVMGVHPDADADLPAAIRDLSAGKIDQAAFLERFGHRGSLEMELAQPRWSEQPESIEPLLHSEGSAAADKATEKCDLETAWQRVADEAKIAGPLRPGLLKELQSLHTFLALRETGKHYLMQGYALLRRILVELDRRHGLDGGIFYLTPAELPRLIGGEDFKSEIAKRRRRRELVLSLEAPQVIFSDDLEAIGRPATLQGSERLQGTPLSAGVAEGQALVLLEPTSESLPAEPFILVCPSTDPAWLPLFVRASGLIMETGGVLSHGAIVAREFGLPAVAGIPDVHRRIRSGQKLHLDGATGVVTLVD
ncbi:MAG: PEP-utilizing enzyme, partial [Gemmataceae bacterium]